MISNSEHRFWVSAICLLHWVPRCCHSDNFFYLLLPGVAEIYHQFSAVIASGQPALPLRAIVIARPSYRRLCGLPRSSRRVCLPLSSLAKHLPGFIHRPRVPGGRDLLRVRDYSLGLCRGGAGPPMEPVFDPRLARVSWCGLEPRGSVLPSPRLLQTRCGWRPRTRCRAKIRISAPRKPLRQRDRRRDEGDTMEASADLAPIIPGITLPSKTAHCRGTSVFLVNTAPASCDRGVRRVQSRAGEHQRWPNTTSAFLDRPNEMRRGMSGPWRQRKRRSRSSIRSVTKPALFTTTGHLSASPCLTRGSINQYDMKVCPTCDPSDCRANASRRGIVFKVQAMPGAPRSMT
mgnify:CR=1 FL=1